MTFSLPDDIRTIRYVSKGASSFFAVIPQLIAPLTEGFPAEQSGFAASLSQMTPSSQLLLRKSIPVMLCIAWETFVDELEATDGIRHAAHFPKGFERYHNEEIKEVFLIRNCIVHCGGKIDAGYVKDSRLKTFAVAGTAIDFTEVQLDTQFKLFGDTFAKIIA